jgi:sugar phosphate isomerase/epimerase
MKIGFMMAYDKERMLFAKDNGFGSAELRVNLDDEFFPGQPDWEKKAEEMKAAFDARGLRISCLAAFYGNHFDPGYAETGHKLVRGSIELAEKIGTPAVAGFSGKLPIDVKLEDNLPKFKEVWAEHARFAEDHGVKIAFEHCPMGWYHMPPGGNNCMCTPWMWERGFNEVGSDALGLEWDPSHLIGLLIDPVQSLREFGDRVHHVHAKDAHVHPEMLGKYGLFAPGVCEHCFVGLGDTNWGLCIKELVRHGYDNDLNIEGWHDQVYRDRKDGAKLEDHGLLISLKHLSQFVF